MGLATTVVRLGTRRSGVWLPSPSVAARRRRADSAGPRVRRERPAGSFVPSSDGRIRMTASRAGEGQVALVTGASMGIGVDLAECFAKDGYDLILTARSQAALETVARDLATRHGVKTVA